MAKKKTKTKPNWQCAADMFLHEKSKNLEVTCFVLGGHNLSFEPASTLSELAIEFDDMGMVWGEEELKELRDFLNYVYPEDTNE